MENSISRSNYVTQTDSGGGFQSSSEKFAKLSRVERFEAEAIPHLPILKQVAMNLVRNPTEAEDLVQETFAQALKSFDSYEAGTNCRGWLCKIMFHKRSQWIRSNVRYCQFPENDLQFPAVSRSAMLPPDFMSEKLRRSLMEIPDKFRQIIRLSILEEFTYREISDKLNIPIGTVMSRLHRGRKMLRDNYFQFTGDKPSHNN